VHTLVTADQLVGKGEARHQTTFFEPENGAEAAREEDTLDGGEGYQALSEAVGGIDPLKGPVRLQFNTFDVIDCLEEVLRFSSVIDVGVNEDRVRLRVNVLHHHLKAVEAASLWHLDLRGEALGQVLEDDSV